MTRDEAKPYISVLVAAFHGNDFSPDERAKIIADTFSALGMLKLEEPNSVDDKLLEALAAHGYGFLKPDILRTSLESSGLKIVEK